MKDIDYTLLEEQASWIGGLMDDERLEAIERTALRGVWNLLHAMLDDRPVKIVH